MMITPYHIEHGKMKNLNQHQQEIKLFFIYWAIYSFMALVTTNFDGKTRTEILNNLFLREVSGLIIGLFCSVGSLLGKALYYYLRNKYKRNENDVT